MLPPRHAAVYTAAQQSATLFRISSARRHWQLATSRQCVRPKKRNFVWKHSKPLAEGIHAIASRYPGSTADYHSFDGNLSLFWWFGLA
jgi:hypothetical protein